MKQGDTVAPINRSFKHWTPSYIANRLSVMVYECRHPDAPWLTQPAIRFLGDWLNPTDVGLEWGSGRSTAWFASRVRHLTSVEHHADWYKQVSLMLEKRRLNNVTYELIPVENSDKCGAHHPYVEICGAIPQSSLDFALVDGIAFRDYCVEAALSRLKVGGLLILDNANWYLPHASTAPGSVAVGGSFPTETWMRVAERLQRLRYYWTSNGVWDTAIFFNR